MEGKRLLKWESAIDGTGNPCLRAQTKFGTCDVYDDHSWCVYDIDSGEADSQEAALDACETAYVKVCTEFLTAYNPATHVVVSREIVDFVAATFENDNVDFVVDGHTVDRETVYSATAAELRAALEGKSC